jgi:hypothetical protein
VGALQDATEAALVAATHLTDSDQGTVEALRVLARKIDEDEARWELALRWAEAMKLRPPSQDNVSLPTYLRYCEALGLTPSGREKLKPAKGGEGGKLAQLRAVR